MSDYLAINKAAYDLAAIEYGDRIAEYQERDKQLLEPFISYLESHFGSPSILELGPGSGLAVKMFTERGIHTTAIELSEKIIDVARTTSPSTDFINDDFLAYNFDGKRFDGLFAKAFIHLFPKDDALRVLAKIHDLLNEDGVLFLATTVHDQSSEGLEEKSDYDTTPVRFRKKWTANELHEALADNWSVLDENYNEERGKVWLALTLVKK